MFVFAISVNEGVGVTSATSTGAVGEARLPTVPQAAAAMKIATMNGTEIDILTEFIVRQLSGCLAVLRPRLVLLHGRCSVPSVDPS